MKTPGKATTSSRPPSLADYLQCYDLAQTLHEARLDYGSVSTGAPRLMSQKDISSRFRKAHTPTRTKPPHE